jgi:hypothetical protein
LLSEAYFGHATRLAHVHAALSEALDRTQRGDRRVVPLLYTRRDMIMPERKYMTTAGEKKEMLRVAKKLDWRRASQCACDGS